MKSFRFLAALLLSLPICVLAQGFPSQTVKIVVPYAAGGGVDVLARGLADKLQKKWGKAVIVDNKAGASTIIGASAVAKATPDGHTLLLTSEATITSNPFLFQSLPYDPVKGLAPISRLVSHPQMVIANPSVRANTMDELVALAKSKPNGLSYASYGSGSLPHLLFEGLKHHSGIELNHVPYKGISPAVLAVLSGEVDLTLAGVPGALAHIATGKLKPIAVGRAERLPSLPNVPTLREAGYADIDPHESWFGLFAPGGTPPAIVQKIYADVAAITADPAFRQARVTDRGFDPVFSTPEEFAKFIQTDMTQKGRLIKISGAKAE